MVQSKSPIGLQIVTNCICACIGHTFNYFTGAFTILSLSQHNKLCLVCIQFQGVRSTKFVDEVSLDLRSSHTNASSSTWAAYPTFRPERAQKRVHHCNEKSGWEDQSLLDVTAYRKLSEHLSLTFTTLEMSVYQSIASITIDTQLEDVGSREECTR